jgi:DNA-binding SARP family transcriptional activator
MDFRILGPLEVLENGRAINVGGAKQRALLAVLLLNANRVVSGDDLLEALWGEHAPETAHKALLVYVSQLRKVLGRERILTKKPGYQAHIEQGELDLERFQELSSEGKLREALALWRGSPLADFTFEPFAQAEIARLGELRLAALEERVEADLASGRHAQLAAELEGLLSEYPLRERLRGQLMLALYRAGRQADALDAYQTARRALVEELGIEPGRQLRELQQAILNQDPRLDLPVVGLPDSEEPAPSDALAPAEPTMRDVRKTVTAICTSVVISSLKGEPLDPEALRRVTSRAFAEIGAGVERHGGTVELVAGDAITAVFGLPVVHEDDALRGVRAAAEVRDALRGLAAELGTNGDLGLSSRIGISTGEVVAGGDIGSHLGATGEPLIRCSRVGQSAHADEILFDQTTRQLVRDAVVAEPAGDQWRLLQVADAVPGPAKRLVSPMIGRERERHRLKDAFDQVVADRSCQLFTVLGLAGVGKSRLVQEFLGGVAGEALVAHGRCLSYGDGITYWPLLEAVRGTVGLDDTDSPDEARAKLIRALGEEHNAELVAQRVAEMIGLVEAAGGAEEGFAAVRTLFEVLARTQPLALVFDDIHWGEETFLDLVEHLADSVRGAPILLLCLARPELLDVRPSWAGGKLNATSTLLEPLSEEESARLIDNLAGDLPVEAGARRRIVEAAEGNPLFLEEMLALRMEQSAETELQVPPTIQALLAARLDLLSGGERAAIEAASVEGKVFHEGSIGELMPEALRSHLRETLGALVRKELIRPDRPAFSGEHAFRFHHLLIRDAAYESIPKEARAELHERHATWLELKAGDNAAEYDEILGYHLEQAFRHRAELGPVDESGQALGRRAAELLGVAARRAFLRSDGPAAVNLISRAVALLPPDDPLRVDLIPTVRDLQGMGGDMSWADRVLTEAVEAAATTGDRRLVAHALVQRGFLRLYFTEREITSRELIEVANRAIAVFEELGDELGLARAWRLVAQAHYLGRSLEESAQASERALEHVRRTEDRFEEREIVEWLAISLFLGPVPALEAARRCRALLAHAAGRPLSEALLSSVVASLEAMQGRTAEAEELLERARRAMDNHGEQVWLFPLRFADFTTLVADPAAAERELRWGYDALGKSGEKNHFSWIAVYLARAAYALERYEEADRLVQESELAARPNSIHVRILVGGTRAKLLARQGDFRAAESLAREAVAFAGGSDFVLAHGAALMDFGELLSLERRRGEAASAIEAARSLYERKGDVVSASNARARLQDLTSA